MINEKLERKEDKNNITQHNVNAIANHRALYSNLPGDQLIFYPVRTRNLLIHSITPRPCFIFWELTVHPVLIKNTHTHTLVSRSLHNQEVAGSIPRRSGDGQSSLIRVSCPPDSE